VKSSSVILVLITDYRPLIPGTERPACFEIVPTARAVRRRRQIARSRDSGISRCGSLRPKSCDAGSPKAYMENANQPSIFIKGGLGAISSSRCQTTRARPGEPERARIFQELLDEQREPAKGTRSCDLRSPAVMPRLARPPIWWSQTGSNRRPPACKAGALPTELWPLQGSDIRGQ
jgi:hypothetical protein